MRSMHKPYLMKDWLVYMYYTCFALALFSDLKIQLITKQHKVLNSVL